MRYLFLNLKRFDIPTEYGGVNRLAAPKDWGREIIAQTQEGLRTYSDAQFVDFFPEAHLIPRAKRLQRTAPFKSAARVSSAKIRRRAEISARSQQTAPPTPRKHSAAPGP